MRRDLAPVIATVAALTACGGSSHSGALHSPGDESFISPAPGAAPGAAVAGASPTVAAGSSQDARAVEEPDIYGLAGNTLYVLNAYRGLLVVDVSDPASPRLVGRVRIEGRPVGLYVRGATVFVAVAGTFQYVAVDGGASVRAEQTSRILAVDVSAPAAPTVLADLPVDGDLDETRIVGNVLYAVSRHFSWEMGVATTGGTSAGGSVSSGVAVAGGGADHVDVSSFDVSDPRAVRAVDSRGFDAIGWDTHANVTSSRITLSQSGWDGSGPVTRFQVIDISDPAGALVIGATFSCPGIVRDRWAMDFDPATDLFRAVAETGWSSGATLRVWSSPAPSSVEEIGHLDLAVPETLTAARFDGSRAYLVTAVQTDPLFIVDTADPTHPRLLGELQMPGWLDFVEPRGNRLLALGHQMSSDGAAWQLTVSLLSVTDSAAPTLLSRVAFGSSWSWVGVSPDDFRKAFQVLDSLGLVLVPVQGWDAATWQYAGGTQLIDWIGDALALRGFLSHAGAITRAFVIDAASSRLGALSDQTLQLIDASDRDHPVELSNLELARAVAAVALVEGKAVELAGDWYRGATELVVTEALDPDAAMPLARIAVPAPYARMYRDGDIVWLLADDWRTGDAWVQAVDLSIPAAAVLRGRLDLAQDAGSWFGGGFGYGDQAVQVGRALVLHRARYAPIQAAAAPDCTGCSASDALTVVDLSDPDRPSATQVTLPASDWSWGLVAAGGYAWMSHYEWVAGSEGFVRYYVDRVDVSDPNHPVLLPAVNVPGVFFTADPGGTRIYTQEVVWKAGEPSATTWIHSLDFTTHGTARLSESVSLDGAPGGATVSGGRAYLQLWTYTGVAIAGGAAGTAVSSSPAGHLAAVDLGAMQVTSTQEIDSGWAWPITAAGGKLFLAAGGWGQGVLVYDLADPGRPRFDRFVRTQGWVEDIAVGNGLAYLACGPYGVVTVPLAPSPM